MGVNEFLAWIGGVIVVLSAIGSAFALVRGAYTKATIEALRGDNKDLREKVTDLRNTVSDMEHEHERDQLEKLALSERVSHLENENDLLKQLVTQRADVETVKKTIDQHHKTLEKHHQAAMDGQSAILTTLRKLTEETA